MSKRPHCGKPVQAGPTPHGVVDGVSIDGCAYPRMKGKRQCIWHWLSAQSPQVQKQHAEQRLGMYVREWGMMPESLRARVPREEWPPGERWCAGCQSFVPLFYTSGSRCKACASGAAHAARVEKVYGISAEQYDDLLRRQGGRCAICRNIPRSMRLAVDHDHKTDAVRGLLCKRCNHDLLGGGHDDVELLWRAIAYLLWPPASYDQATVTREHVLSALDARLDLKRLLATPTGSEAPQPPPF